jgi:hypothetical protein
VHDRLVNECIVEQVPVPHNSGDFVEAVFWPEIFRIFSMISGRFLPESTGSWQESIGKNLGNFRPEYCFYVPAVFGVFFQDTVTFPHLFYRILRDPVAGIFDLGN